MPILRVWTGWLMIDAPFRRTSPGRRDDEAGDHHQGGGLSRAARPEERHELPRPYIEGNRFGCDEVTAMFAKIFQLDLCALSSFGNTSVYPRTWLRHRISVHPSCPFQIFQPMIFVAAEEIGVTQPAVSKIIKALEGEFGVVLFERRKGRLVPAPEAKYLKNVARSLLDQINDVQRHLKDYGNLRVGDLRVLSIPGPTVFFFRP
jgi:hypothetical protein